MRLLVFLLPALLCLTITARARPAPPPGQQRVPLGDGRTLIVSAPHLLTAVVATARDSTRRAGPGKALHPPPAFRGVQLFVTRNRFVSGDVRAPKQPDACAVLLHVTVQGRVLPPITLSFGATRDSAKPMLAPDESSAWWGERGGVYGSTFAVVPAP